jgi:hypothetical protein
MERRGPPLCSEDPGFKSRPIARLSGVGFPQSLEAITNTSSSWASLLFSNRSALRCPVDVDIVVK